MTQPFQDPWPLVPKDQSVCTVDGVPHKRIEVKGPKGGTVWSCPKHDFIYHRTCSCHRPKEFTP